ncbi:MAG TPA: hypothetical protein VFQ30_18195 [Ktedonobacteraceae bacterium]|nr:hypothetical protein [Ktedonobacteraceae bacterium]
MRRLTLPKYGLRRGFQFNQYLSLEERTQLVERRLVHAAVLLKAVMGPRLQLVDAPGSPGHPNDRHVEVTAPDHRL